MAGQLDKLQTAIAERPAGTGQKTINDFIQESTSQLAAALPDAANLTPERFARLAMTVIKTNPKLASCTRDSMLGAMMTSAHLGLEPGPLDLVYWTPRGRKGIDGKWRDEVHLIVSYKGFLELARRAGVQMVARPVYANDDFEIEYGFEESVRHKPALADRGDVIGYYLAARWDGGRHVSFMTKDDIERIRLRSDAGKDNKGPWATDYDVMACKTVVRFAFNRNYIPRTVEIGRALNVDETVQSGWRGEDQLDRPRPIPIEAAAKELEGAERQVDDTGEASVGSDELRDGGSGDNDDGAVDSGEGDPHEESDRVVVESDGASDVDRVSAPRRPDDVPLAEWLVGLTEEEVRAVCRSWLGLEIEFLPKTPKAWASLAKQLSGSEPF